MAPVNAATLPAGHRNGALNGLTDLFNEAMMGFLALVALATAIGPLVFQVSPGVERLLTFVEWTLVAAFATEFVVHGYQAGFSREWRRSPWRIVDVVTVIGPVVALLPQVSDLARGSLMLRMLRVVRAVAFGTRAGTVAVRSQEFGRQETPSAPAAFMVLSESATAPAGSNWPSLLASIRNPGDSWFHASGLDSQQLTDLAAEVGLSTQERGSPLGEEGHAKLHEHGDYTMLVLQIPTVAQTGEPTIQRDRFFAVIRDRGLSTATGSAFDLPGFISTRVSSLPKVAFPVRITCAILTVVQERYAAVVQRFEDEVRRLEAMSGGINLLRSTFRLRRQLASMALDLRHVKAIVRKLADGKTKLRGVDLKDEQYIDELLAETESLFERLETNKDELQTLMELHINFKSFEMNSFLKVLAVISALGLIPTVVGGLFGMNLMGNPWPLTLSQVSFIVAMGMASALYVFAATGWLK